MEKEWNLTEFKKGSQVGLGQLFGVYIYFKISPGWSGSRVRSHQSAPPPRLRSGRSSNTSCGIVCGFSLHISHNVAPNSGTHFWNMTAFARTSMCPILSSSILSRSGLFSRRLRRCVIEFRDFLMLAKSSSLNKSILIIEPSISTSWGLCVQMAPEMNFSPLIPARLSSCSFSNLKITMINRQSDVHFLDKQATWWPGSWFGLLKTGPSSLLASSHSAKSLPAAFLKWNPIKLYFLTVNKYLTTCSGFADVTKEPLYGIVATVSCSELVSRSNLIKSEY